MESWALVVADFHHLLGIDVEAQFSTMGWRRFRMLVCAMLAYPESLLGMWIDGQSKAPAAPAADEHDAEELTA